MDKDDEMLEELKKIRAAVEKPPAPCDSARFMERV